MGSINAQILALGVIMWQDVRDGDHHTFSTPITRVAAVRSESANSPLSRYQRYCKSYIPFVVCYGNERFAIVCSTWLPCLPSSFSRPPFYYHRCSYVNALRVKYPSIVKRSSIAIVNSGSHYSHKLWYLFSLSFHMLFSWCIHSVCKRFSWFSAFSVYIDVLANVGCLVYMQMF